MEKLTGTVAILEQNTNYGKLNVGTAKYNTGQKDRYLYFHRNDFLNKQEFSSIVLSTKLKFFITVGERGYRACEIEIVEEQYVAE